jgi:hypothetical protein
MFHFYHKHEAIVYIDCPFLFYEHAIVIHVLPNSFAFLFEKSEKKNFMAFLQSVIDFKWMSSEIGFKMEFKFPFSNSFFFINKSVRRIQVSIHLLDWLHMHFCIT